MHKKIKVVLSSAALMLAIGTTSLSYAAPVDDLKQALIAAGVPDNYIGNAVDYLQKINLTQAKVNAVKAKINQANALTGGVKDLSKLDADVKNDIKKLATEAGNIVGLSANFGKDASGKTTVSFTTPSGGVLAQVDSTNAGNLNTGAFTNVLDKALELPNNKPSEPDNPNDNGSNKPNEPNNNGSNKDDQDTPVYKPVGGGTLNNTATDYSTMMLAGTTIMGAAGTMHVVSKKRK